ncbi:MAG: T9SS type A sorting domain-containing protein [Spirosomataceae bacterium]
MKNNLKCTLLVSGLCLALGASAQTSESTNIETQKDKLRIQVERETNGKKQIFDKTYDTKGMSSADVDKLRERVLDSLDQAAGRTTHRNWNFNRKSDREEDVVIREKRNKEERDRPKKAPRIYIERDGMTRRLEGFDFKFDDRDFKRKMERLNDKMEDWGKQWNKNWDKLKFDLKGTDLHRLNGEGPGVFFYDGGGSNSKTVKGLNVYPNTPFNNKLNLRFTTPEKGDVTIVVTDVTGKEVGKEKLKDFSGDYLGQIDVKGKDKGTFFVTVTQGEDGVVKRVVVN